MRIPEMFVPPAKKQRCRKGGRTRLQKRLRQTGPWCNMMHNYPLFRPVSINVADEPFFFELQQYRIINEIVRIHFPSLRNIFGETIECKSEPLTFGDRDSFEDRRIRLITFRENFLVFGLEIFPQHPE